MSVEGHVGWLCYVRHALQLETTADVDMQLCGQRYQGYHRQRHTAFTSTHMSDLQHSMFPP